MGGGWLSAYKPGKEDEEREEEEEEKGSFSSQFMIPPRVRQDDDR